MKFTLKQNLLLYGFLTALSAHFAVAYAIGPKFYVDVAQYQNGMAKLPFMYRALMAWTIHAFMQIQAFVDIVHRAQLPAPFDQPEIIVLTGINILSVIALTEFVRRSIAIFVEDPLLTAVLSFLMPLSMYFSYVALASNLKHSYPYDIPNLPLFAACIYGILKRKLVLMQVSFLLACLSRETSVFLIAIYLLYELDRLKSAPLQIAGNILLMGAVLALTKWILFRMYEGNPLELETYAGGLFGLRLQENFIFLTHPQNWPNLLSSGGFLWVTLFATYKYLPKGPLRRTLWVAVPWVVLMGCVGLLTEVRVFGELTILLAILSAVGIARYLKAHGFRSGDTAIRGPAAQSGR